MKRAAAWMTAAAVAIGLLVPAAPALAADQSDVARIQAELDQITDRYRAAQREASAAQRAYDKAVEEMAKLQLKAEAAQKDVAKSQARLDLANSQLADLLSSSSYYGAGLQQLGAMLSSDGLESALRNAEAIDQVGGDLADARAVYTAAQNNAKHAAGRQAKVVEAQRAAIKQMDGAKRDADGAVSELAAQRRATLSKRDTLIADIAKAKRISEEQARKEQAAREASRAKSGAGATTPSGSRDNGSSDSGSKPKPKPPNPAPPAPPGGGVSGNVPAAYRGWVARAGSQCGAIRPSLIAAQVHAESGWNPNAVSSVGAQGLSQFMPGTWAAWGRDADGNGRTSPFDPGDAIVSQGAYMCALYAEVSYYRSQGRVSGDLISLTLAAYNAGSGNVLRYEGVPPFGETKAYISRILSLASSTYA